MAKAADRAMAVAAAALLPGLLPTPPRRTMIAPPCLIILPASFSSSKLPKPGRADSVERWDAHKNNEKIKPCNTASSGGSSSGSSGSASSCERWDNNKIKNPSSSSTSSSSSREGNSKSPGRADSAERWDSNKRRPPSRASSADRWDTHKKPRSAQADAEGRTGEQEEQEMISSEAHKDGRTATVAAAARTDPVFPEPSFFASPEPGMLTVPAFLLAH